MDREKDLYNSKELYPYYIGKSASDPNKFAAWLDFYEEFVGSPEECIEYVKIKLGNEEDL